MPSDAWDALLERLTETLVELTAGRKTGFVTVRAAQGWLARVAATKRTVSVQVEADPATGMQVPLDDYQRVLLFGLEYQPFREWPPADSYAKSLTIKEGYEWDEQTLREIALEALGILRYVLGIADAGGIELSENLRAPRAAAVTRRVRRPRR
jgi:hypothetical protein